MQIGGVQPPQNLHLLAFGELERLKAIKKKTLIFVGAAHTRDLLKKVNQNFHKKVRANIATNPNLKAIYRMP